MQHEQDATSDVADRVQAIITRQHPDGSYAYTKEECRQFIVCAVMDLGLPLPPGLEGVFTRFLELQVGVKKGDSDDQVLAAIREYNKQHPLNAQLVAEITALSTSEGVKQAQKRDGYNPEEHAREQMARARTGADKAEARAPQPDEKKAPAPKLKKGLT